MAEPDLGAATKEAREALAALNLKAEIARLSRPPPPRPLPQPEPGGAPSNAALSLASIGCARGCRQTWTTAGRRRWGLLFGARSGSRSFSRNRYYDGRVGGLSVKHSINFS